MDKNFLSAIEYAAKNVESYRIDHVVAEIYRTSAPAKLIDSTIDSIVDFMNEWAEDNEVAQDFWMDEYDDDDVVFAVYDYLHN